MIYFIIMFSIIIFNTIFENNKSKIKLFESMINQDDILDNNNISVYNSIIKNIKLKNETFCKLYLINKS